jgi:hypothetical protein
VEWRLLLLLHVQRGGFFDGCLTALIIDTHGAAVAPSRLHCHVSVCVCGDSPVCLCVCVCVTTCLSVFHHITNMHITNTVVNSVCLPLPATSITHTPPHTSFTHLTSTTCSTSHPTCCRWLPHLSSLSPLSSPPPLRQLRTPPTD